MTHEGFLDTGGGFIRYSAPNRIYEAAAELGLRDFVVPGNQVALVERYRRLLEDLLGEDGFTLYAPGFVTQGGDISETGRVAGNRWHAIVGSAIYKHETREGMREAALRLMQQIL